MYKNLWKPFLTIRERYIDLDFPWFIGTDGSENDIRSIVGENMIPILYSKRADNTKNYFERILHYLNHIPYEYIVFWYDDMFPTSDINAGLFEKSVQLLRENSFVQLVKLSNCSFPFEGPLYEYNGTHYTRASDKNNYIMNVQPTIFRRSFLIDMCSYIHASPFATNGPSSLETIGTEYCQLHPSNIYLRSVIDIVPILCYSGIVISGVLVNGAKEFLKRECIQIDLYENECIYDIRKKENTDTLNSHLKWQLSEFYRINV